MLQSLKNRLGIKQGEIYLTDTQENRKYPSTAKTILSMSGALLLLLLPP